MRLTPEEINGIVTALSIFMASYNSELRLYGSRTKDELKGGDIDLLLITEQREAATNLLMQKHKILAAIKQLIGEQRIDFKIIAKAAIHDDPFVSIILPQSILLHSWKNSIN
jgi:hypothetical protein